MYLFKKGLPPNYFQDMFTLASQVHSHNTRNSNRFYTFPCQTNFRKFSIWFRGPKFFNSLSQEIQDSESIGLFGKRLKNSLLLGHINCLNSYILVSFLFFVFLFFFSLFFPY